MNILIVSLWFERGQGIISRQIYEALIPKHKVFVLARRGYIVDDNLCKGYGFIERTGRRSAFLDDKDYWNIPNLIKLNSYEISKEQIKDIIERNRIDIAIFNEENDFQLVEYVKSLGIKIASYVDFFTKENIPKFKVYDALLCSSIRTYNAFSYLQNAYYTPWGVDLNWFKPSERPEFSFFHNAGWAGTGMRKGTIETLRAFRELMQQYKGHAGYPNFSLLVHTQKSISSYPGWVRELFKFPQIKIHEGTLRKPGLYNKGMIYVAPSRIEGLGLHILEALASGLPVITTNAPPMNEYVRDKENGLLAKVRHSQMRTDHFYSPEKIVDVNDLKCKMNMLVMDKELYGKLRDNTIRYAKENLDWKKNGKKVLEIIDGLQKH